MRSEKSALITIFMIVLADVLAMVLVVPMLPFFAEQFGATPFQIGLIFSVYSLGQLIAGPFLGLLSDRIGRRPVLLLSQVGTLLGLILLLFSRSLAWVFVARAVDGLTSGNLTVAQAHLADQVSAEKRTLAFGRMGLAFGIGFMLGPAASGFLVQFNIHYPVLLGCFFSALSIATTFFLLDENRGSRSSENKLGLSVWLAFGQLKKNSTLLCLFGFFFLHAFASSSQLSGLALFLERRFTWNGTPFKAREVGFVYAYLGLLGVVFQVVALKSLVKRMNDAQLVKLGFVFMVLGFAAQGFSGSVVVFLAALATSCLGIAILRPGLQNLIVKKSHKAQHGMALGMAQSLQSVSQTLAPLVSGSLIQQGLLVGWTLVGASLSGICLLASWLLDVE